MENTKNVCQFRKIEKKENINGGLDTYNTFENAKNKVSCNNIYDYIRKNYSNNKMYLNYLLNKNTNNKKFIDTINKVCDTTQRYFTNGIVYDTNENKTYYRYDKNECDKYLYVYGKYLKYGYHDNNSNKYLEFDLKNYENKDINKLGVELELQFDNGNYSTYSRDVHHLLVDKIGGVNTSDCTAHLEFVSGAKSMQRWLDLENNLKTVFDTLNNKYCLRDYKDRYFTCGGHIHIDRVNDEQAKRVLLIVEKYKEQLYKLSRRKETNRKDSYNMFWSDFYNMDYIKNNINRIINSSSHAVSVNFQHKNTIELRFWSGFTCVEDLLGSLQISYNIDKLARKDIPLNNIQFSNLLKGKYAKRLAEKVGLLASK